MPDHLWRADIGRASVEALWLPVLAWSVIALVAEGALRLARPGAALALPVRGAVLAALPLAVVAPAVLAALAPEAAVLALAPDPFVWLPEVAVGGAPPEAAVLSDPAIPPVLDVALGLAVMIAGAVGLVHALRLVGAVIAVARARRTLPAASADAQAAVDAARQRLGVGRAVSAAEAPPGAAPFTVGWRRQLARLAVAVSYTHLTLPTIYSV